MAIDPEALISLASVIVSLIVGILGTLLGWILQKTQKKKTEEETSEKFEELSNLLKTAGFKIKEMESEIESKRRRVKELEKLKKELDGLVSLREEQVTAIRAELTSIMEKSARRNRIWTIAIGAIWFVIGLIVRGFLGF